MPVPVIVTYLTAWVGADGVAQFRNDLYGRDQIEAPLVAEADPEACHVDDPALQP
jgi:murein L,D-transpeptidase YcbB/YkuD